MEIVAIGDPHGDFEKVKRAPVRDSDLILLTGDLGRADLMRKMAIDNMERRRKGLEEREWSARERKRAFMEAYNSTMKIVKYLARFAPVYIIYGNVESSNAETREESEEIGLKLPFLTDDLKAIDGVRIINNRIANFNGVRIGGLQYFIDTNWVRNFKPENYKIRMKSAKRQSDKAKRILKWFGDVDILVHHQPPYKVVDKVGPKAPKAWRGKNAGSQIILDYIKKRKPRYTFCGHIHEGEGMKKVGKTEVYNLGVGSYKVVEF